MMFEVPASLTAIVHLRFNYGGPEKQTVSHCEAGQCEAGRIGRILDRAAEMDPELQEILVRFAEYLNHQEGAR